MTDQELNTIASKKFLKENTNILTTLINHDNLQMKTQEAERLNIKCMLMKLASSAPIMFNIAKILFKNEIPCYMRNTYESYAGLLNDSRFRLTETDSLEGLSFTLNNRVFTLTIKGLYEYTEPNMTMLDRLVQYHTLSKYKHVDYDEFDLTDLKNIVNLVAEGYRVINNRAASLASVQTEHDLNKVHSCEESGEDNEKA